MTTPAPFDRYLAGDERALTEQQKRGLRAFMSTGCSGCHSARSTVHAPELAGVAGRPVHLADGRTVIADEGYLRDSILLPRKQVAAGYEPIMPAFAGRIGEDDLFDLIAYIRSLAPSTERPR